MLTTLETQEQALQDLTEQLRRADERYNRLEQQFAAQGWQAARILKRLATLERALNETLPHIPNPHRDRLAAQMRKLQ